MRQISIKVPLKHHSLINTTYFVPSFAQHWSSITVPGVCWSNVCWRLVVGPYEPLQCSWCVTWLLESDNHPLINLFYSLYFQAEIIIVPAELCSQTLLRRTAKGPCWCGWQRAALPHWAGPWQREGRSPMVPPPRPGTRLPGLGRAADTGRPVGPGGTWRMDGRQELCLVSAAMFEVRRGWRHGAVVASQGSTPPGLTGTWRKTGWRCCFPGTKELEKSKWVYFVIIQYLPKHVTSRKTFRDLGLHFTVVQFRNSTFI